MHSMFFYAFSIEPPLRWNVNCFFEKFLTFPPVPREAVGRKHPVFQGNTGFAGKYYHRFGHKKRGEHMGVRLFSTVFPLCRP